MADLKFAVYAVDHASKTFGNVGNSMDKMGDKSSKMGDKFKKFGALAKMGVAAAGVAVGAFAVIAVKAAAEDEASQRKLAQTMKKTQKATDKQIETTEKWIDATSRASGVADDELRPALSKMMLAGDSAAEAQEHVALAMDIATAAGKPLASVTAAMAKGALGSTGGLGKLGLATKDAAGEALTYNEILDQARKKMGGASADAADTYQGKMDRLKVAFNEAKESIGAKLLPILTKLADFVLDYLIPGLDKLSPIWDAIVGAFDKGSEAGGALSEIFGTMKDVASDVFQTLKEVVADVAAKFEEHRPQMELFFTRLIEIAKPVAKFFIEIWAKQLKGVFKVVGKAIEIVITVISKLVDWTPTILQDFIKPVVLGFISMAQLIVAAADNAFGWIPGIGDKLGKARAAIDNFKDKTEKQFDSWAYNLRKQGEAAGTNFSKGLVKGLAKARGVSVDVARRDAANAVRVRVPPELRARGGPVTAGRPYIVGEKRPELFVPNRSGTIVPKVPNGGVTVIINGSVLSDDRKIAAAVLQALKSTRSGGRSLGLT